MYARYHNGSEWENQPIDDLTLTLTPTEIEHDTGMTRGCHVADVDVDNGDGTYSRFFLSIRMNKRDQPVFEVASASASDKVVSKSVVGFQRTKS